MVDVPRSAQAAWFPVALQVAPPVLGWRIKLCVIDLPSDDAKDLRLGDDALLYVLYVIWAPLI